MYSRRFQTVRTRLTEACCIVCYDSAQPMYTLSNNSFKLGCHSNLICAPSLYSLKCDNKSLQSEVILTLDSRHKSSTHLSEISPLHPQLTPRSQVLALRASVHIPPLICCGESSLVFNGLIILVSHTVVSFMHYNQGIIEAVFLLSMFLELGTSSKSFVLLSKQSDPFVFFSKRTKSGLHLKHNSNILQK